MTPPLGRLPMTALACALAVAVGCSQPPPPPSPPAAVAAAPELYAPFRQACIDALARPVEGTPKLVHGLDGWLFERGELAYIRAGRFWGAAATAANPKAPPEHADPLPAIVDFNRQLAAHGIQLLFVPLPAREEIYPESVLAPELLAGLSAVPRINPLLAEFLAELAGHGIHVVDVTPLLLAHRDDRAQPLFLRSDPHLTPTAIEVVAQTIAAELERGSWYRAVPHEQLVESRTTIDYAGPEWRTIEKASGESLGSERVAVRTIARVTPHGTQALDLSNPSSPVLVLGDSQTRWWQPQHASFFEQLSFELGFPVDLMMTAGGGANDARLELVRAAREDPTTLDRLRAVVWYFSALPLANEADGWLELPLPAPAPGRD